MEEYSTFFKNKKITLVGLGLLGRGVGDARFLAEMGADLVVTDLKTEKELDPSLKELRHFKNIRYTLGRHELADFNNRDLVLNGQAVPTDSPYLAEAKRNAIPVSNSTALFARLARAQGATLVGITGTRGKSTTTHLIAAALDAAHRNVILGGNVRGMSTLALLPQVTPETVVVLELDSWLLQGFRDEWLSPDIAVFTTFYDDHLNYYHGDTVAYLADKAEIFLHQKSGSTLVLGQQATELIQQTYKERIAAKVVVAQAADVPPTWKFPLPGEHNRDNAACALAALRALGVLDYITRATFENFNPLPGRLERVREVRGVTIYNDNSATTPDATIVALRALGDPKNRKIVLVMGGDDKNLDMAELVKEIPKWCSKVVLFKERGTERVRDDIFATKKYGVDVYEEEGLEATIARAIDVAKPGEVLLYSPAFSSFGKYFKNEYDRGDQFMRLVAALI